MVLLILACVGSGFVISCLATAGMRWLAPRVGLIDQPNSARKVHLNPTPLGGGLGVLAGVVVPLLVGLAIVTAVASGALSDSWLPEVLRDHVAGVLSKRGSLAALLVGGLVISAVGLLDDLRPLAWRPKLLVQFLVAGGLVASGVRATVFAQAAWVGDLITLFWIVGLTNSFNFLDNMDALSGGIGLIAATVFATILLTATATPHWFVAAFLLLIAGSLAGFLVHNRPPAKIFMGDAGSCLIGLWIASLTVLGTFYDDQQSGRHVILAPLCVLAVPLYDFCSVILIRLRQGRSPFHADKSHFSHRLVELGLSKTSAVLTIHLVTLMTGLAGLLLYQVGDWNGAIVVMTMVLCALAVIGILETAGRLRRESEKRS